MQFFVINYINYNLLKNYRPNNFIFKVSISSISKIVPEVCDQIVKTLRDYVKVSYYNVAVFNCIVNWWWMLLRNLVRLHPDINANASGDYSVIRLSDDRGESKK